MRPSLNQFKDLFLEFAFHICSQFRLQSPDGSAQAEFYGRLSFAPKVAPSERSRTFAADSVAERSSVSPGATFPGISVRYRYPQPVQPYRPSGRACRGFNTGGHYVNVHRRCQRRRHRRSAPTPTRLRSCGGGCRRPWLPFGASGIPMRSSRSGFRSKCPLEYRRQGGGKYSRINPSAPFPARSQRTSRTGVANILGFSRVIRPSPPSTGLGKPRKARIGGTPCQIR